MTETPAAVPYEKQFDLQATRTCGAACLSMVYRSFGQEIPQRLIWPLIAKKNIYGSIASTTHLMAADAVSRGFAAVAIQARHPLQALRVCRDSGIRAILNHRLQPDSPAGHYTVLVDIDATIVKLHDPYFGPSRRLTHDVFLDLWQPRLPKSEIVGNFLIGLASESPDLPACEVCHTAFLKRVQCPRCKNAVSLEPVALLGCMNNSCAARLWNYVCCPTCDLTWNFTLEPPRSSAAASASAPAEPAAVPAAAAPTAALPSGTDPLNLGKLFAEIDKFSNHILSLPAAANHPEIQQQLAFITASKEKLAAAMAQELAKRKAHQENLGAMAKAAKEKQDAHRKRVEDLNKPSPPLDGDALARALLKDLGITN
jgi:hypothetical protein